MAVSAIIGAISAGGVALGITAPIFAGGLLGLGAVFTQFLVTTAMGAALNALAPKPNFSGLNSASRGYSISGESGAALDHQIIYGEARVGGVRIYDASTGTTNEFLHRIVAFAGHEIEGYQQIYLNDEIVTVDPVTGNVTSPSRYNGFVRIKRYFGSDTQLADPDLISETASLVDGKWTSDHRLLGIAYLYVRFKYSQDAFPNGIPSVSATIRGKKVFDPRTSTTAWSDNPALCLRDYLTSEYGLNQNASKVEDTLVITAANICDQTVSGEKRYTCNGSFLTSFQPSQNISDLLSSMGGLFWYSQGKWRMKAAYYVTPTVTLDENDLRSGISLSTRHSRRSNFNTIKGKFKGNETDWQEADYPAVSDPVFVTADNGVVNTLDYPLPFTSSSKTAQRIANIALRRNREQLTFSASFGLKAFQIEVGDFVYINNQRFGWTNKVFEVTNWTFGLTESLDLQVQMTLREISSSVFTDESAAVFELNNTTLPSIFDGLTINNLTVAQTLTFKNDASFVPNLLVSWQAVLSPFVDYYEVIATPIISGVSQTPLVYRTRQTSIEFPSIGEFFQYSVSVRATSLQGNSGTTSTKTVNAMLLRRDIVYTSSLSSNGGARALPAAEPQYFYNVTAPAVVREYVSLTSNYDYTTSNFCVVSGWIGSTATVNFNGPQAVFTAQVTTTYTSSTPVLRQFPVTTRSTVWGATASLDARISITLL